MSRPFSLVVVRSHLKWEKWVDRMRMMRAWFPDWGWQVLLVLIVLDRYLDFGGIGRKRQKCHH